ncbi:Mitogen-activated protein kinase kinase kinase 1 [Acorus gramineus]|uniref:mitogen-activated protein kinase kinase kinase n=1 Tax=Acorus gramineus TaxID=55184 RepID=A0AAV9AJ34_ACOGR|nr:Mitogen-activated protein kinase kinase kinase 1 [Acorus gramineus]
MDLKKKKKSPKRKLERRNAVKNIDYDPSQSPYADTFPSGNGAVGGATRSRSLDLPQTLSSAFFTEQKSFRVEGNSEGQFALLCQNLGLSGPEDFAIPTAAWEAARRSRSSSEFLPSEAPAPRSAGPVSDPLPSPPDWGGGVDLVEAFRVRVSVSPGGVGGIKGARPPSLTPPPSMSLPSDFHKLISTWDIFNSLAPDADDGRREGQVKDQSSSEGEEEEEEEEEEVGVGAENGHRVEVGETSASTSNEDEDASSTNTEGAFNISPVGRLKRDIRGWMKGRLLGSGSFGTVYEGISSDGFFFAVKEVSLLDQGDNAKQCIYQLEQEIALLSQFEHENIVQYLGTEKDKEEAKLHIFLELVTQGSLAKTYERYRLRDSQVSAYTRQILNGLRYLHDRKVVHRDIKCANLLVDANGSVKLADFGLAKEVTNINGLKSCKGSVYWMAPEVVKSQPYGPAADIWSLGCTVLEMLTHQIPYPNMEWPSALFKIGRGEPPSIPSDLSREARDFIRQCVQVNSALRPSALDLLHHPFVRPVSLSRIER